MVSEVEDPYDGGRGVALGVTPKAVLQEGVTRVAHVAGSNVATPFVFVCLGRTKVNRIYQIHV
jgi:hypothetical protein